MKSAFGSSHLLRAQVTIIVLLACACHSATRSSGPIVVNVEQQQQEATVNVAPNRALEVRIPTQPGTGYSWTLIGAPELMTLAGQSIEPPGSPLVGAWQVQVFRFRVNSAGKETLRFGYRRPWETAKAPVKTFELQITAAQK